MCLDINIRWIFIKKTYLNFDQIYLVFSYWCSLFLQVKTPGGAVGCWKLVFLLPRGQEERPSLDVADFHDKTPRHQHMHCPCEPPSLLSCVYPFQCAPVCASMLTPAPTHSVDPQITVGVEGRQPVVSDANSSSVRPSPSLQRHSSGNHGVGGETLTSRVDSALDCRTWINHVTFLRNKEGYLLL